MDARTPVTDNTRRGHESDFRSECNPAENLDFSRSRLGQNCPQDYPHHETPVSGSSALSHPLGEALTIHEVARLLGCSPWTVRQRYLRQGLPHLQARPRGKLVFFREQVIAWTLKRQRQKGGIFGDSL